MIQIVLTETDKAILMTLLVNFRRTSRKKITFWSQKTTKKTQKGFYQSVAISKSLHFSWECSAGDEESSFQKPSDILSKEWRKILLIIPERQNTNFSENLFFKLFAWTRWAQVPQTCRKSFDKSAEKFVSIAQIDKKIQSFLMKKLSYLNFSSNA